METDDALLSRTGRALSDAAPRPQGTTRTTTSGSAWAENLRTAKSPRTAARREVLEETGLTLTDYRYCGIITFVSDQWETEYMHLFHATGFTGALRECDEGVLEWVPIKQINALPAWEGDKIFSP